MLAYVKLHSLLPVCHINSKMGNVYLLMHPEFLVSVYKGKVTGQPPLYTILLMLSFIEDGRGRT